MRLNIAAGTAVRFEPGEEKDVVLVAFGGSRVIYGFSNLVDGRLDDHGTKERAMRKLADSPVVASRTATCNRIWA